MRKLILFVITTVFLSGIYANANAGGPSWVRYYQMEAPAGGSKIFYYYDKNTIKKINDNMIQFKYREITKVTNGDTATFVHVIRIKWKEQQMAYGDDNFVQWASYASSVNPASTDYLPDFKKLMEIMSKKFKTLKVTEAPAASNNKVHQPPNENKLESFKKELRRRKIMPSLVVKVEPDPYSDNTIVVTVNNEWFYMPKQLRLQTAQNLCAIWAWSYGAEDVVMVLFDLNGNKVGGGGVGSLMEVED